LATSPGFRLSDEPKPLHLSPYAPAGQRAPIVPSRLDEAAPRLTFEQQIVEGRMTTGIARVAAHRDLHMDPPVLESVHEPMCRAFDVQAVLFECPAREQRRRLAEQTFVECEIVATFGSAGVDVGH
jgi:hypothetical protein